MVSTEWKGRVGTGTSVSWPAGVGGKGNEGVAAYVQRIKGAIGLKTSQWDMRVDVTPHIGATVFAGGGALIGGPVGAAAGAVIGGVLGRAINQATQSEYKVTGSWDKPDIVKIGSRRVPKQEEVKAKPASN